MNANLIAFVNGRLDIEIKKYDFQDKWKIVVSKNDDGINLSIKATAEDLDDAINDVYEKWTKITRSAPTLSLNVLEYKPEPHPLNDEVPF